MTDMRTETHITPQTCVIVIGGGYAGTTAANHLRTRGDVDITLVNPRESSSSGSGCTRWWRTPTRRPSTTADMLHPACRSWSTTPPTSTPPTGGGAGVGCGLDYDYLIYAVGSTGAPAGVPGADEFALPSPNWSSRCD